MTAILYASAEFRQRRRRTWRAVRWWLLTGIICGIGFALATGGSDRTMSQDEYTFMLASFSIVAGSLILVIRGILVHYRCPNCNRIPMANSFEAGISGFSFRREVDLNPSECSHCGALLKTRTQD